MVVVSPMFELADVGCEGTKDEVGLFELFQQFFVINAALVGIFCLHKD
jgi:hypothetical protein